MEIFYSGSSQNSDLGQEQLNNMEESAKADNTKRTTKWGLNRFEEWQAERRISFDWKTVSSKELNDILRKCFAEVKTKQGRTSLIIIVTMFIFRAKDSFATLIIIVTRFARADNYKIRAASESSTLKMNIIVISQNLIYKQ